MRHLPYLAGLLLALASTASAETITGEVRTEVVEGAPDRVFIDVPRSSYGTPPRATYELTDPAQAKQFYMFRNETVKVRGTVQQRPTREGETPLAPALTVEETLRPVFWQVQADCVRQGSSNIPYLKVDGHEGLIHGGGPAYRALKHAFDRRLQLEGWFFDDPRDPELKVVRMRGRSLKGDYLLKIGGLGIAGQVAADAPVWVYHSSLWGYSAWIQTPAGVKGYLDYEKLELGEPIPAAAPSGPAPGPASGRGMIDVVPSKKP